MHQIHQLIFFNSKFYSNLHIFFKLNQPFFLQWHFRRLTVNNAGSKKLVFRVLNIFPITANDTPEFEMNIVIFWNRCRIVKSTLTFIWQISFSGVHTQYNSFLLEHDALSSHLPARNSDFHFRKTRGLITQDGVSAFWQHLYLIL